MTQTEAFEAKLSQSNDATTLRGKLVFAVPTTTTPTVQLILSPQNSSNFGVRAAALAGVFSRYRFKYVQIKFLNAIVTGVGITAVGIQDDVAITANNPTSTAGVAELRCSGTTFQSQTLPTQFRWEPVDKNYWYYCTNDLTDGRLSISGEMWVGSNGAGTVDIEIDYCLVFKGATDSGGL